MAQAVSRRPLTAETTVRSRVSPYGICGGQSDTGTGFSPSTLVYPCQFHSTGAPLKFKSRKKPYHHYHRVAQEALRLRCVRSICCGALHPKKIPISIADPQFRFIFKVSFCSERCTYLSKISDVYRCSCRERLYDLVVSVSQVDTVRETAKCREYLPREYNVGRSCNYRKTSGFSVLGLRFKSRPLPNATQKH
jgi:hypothetical protein